MSPTATIHTFYQAIIDKNVDRIHKSYVNKEDTYVISEGPRLDTINYSNMAKGWVDFCESDLTLESIEWQEEPREKIGEELAWIAGDVQFIIGVNEKTFTQNFHASFVLRRENDRWKIRNEHLSGTLEDPYKIGEWLKR